MSNDPRFSEDLYALLGSAQLTTKHDRLYSLSPLYRFYVHNSPDVGSGITPWWFVHRAYDWAWKASAVHDFWYSHEWLAETISDNARDTVDGQWDQTATELAGTDKTRQRQLKIGRFMIIRLGGMFWKP